MIGSILTIILCSIVGVVAFAEIVLMVWVTIDRYMTRRADYRAMLNYMENPVVMVNDRGEEYWVGYRK